MNDFVMEKKHRASTNNWWTLLDGTNTTPSNTLVPLPANDESKKITIGERKLLHNSDTPRKVASSILSAWCFFFCLGFVHSIFRVRIFLYILRTFEVHFLLFLYLWLSIWSQSLGVTLFFLLLKKIPSQVIISTLGLLC